MEAIVADGIDILDIHQVREAELQPAILQDSVCTRRVSKKTRDTRMKWVKQRGSRADD